jgi:hypothetical protein
MIKKNLAKKFILNYMVMGGTGLPNLVINAGTQAVLDIYFHWIGVMAVGAYFVGLVLSMTYSNLFSMWTKSNFRVGKRRYSYAPDEMP